MAPPTESHLALPVETDAACVFCRIASGELPSERLGENEHAVAFRDLHPQAPTHFLVIPKRHVPSLAAADRAAELGALLLLVGDVARALGVAASGFRAVLNTGGDGGQTVYHLHVHVLAGRPLAWPPG